MAKGLRDQKVLRCRGVFCWSSLRKKGRKGLRRRGTATLEGNATLASFLPSPCVTRDQRKFGSLIRQLLLNVSRAVTGIFRWFWLIYFSPEFWTIPTHTCRLGLSQQILHWAGCHFLELQLPEYHFPCIDRIHLIYKPRLSATQRVVSACAILEVKADIISTLRFWINLTNIFFISNTERRAI